MVRSALADLGARPPGTPALVLAHRGAWDPAPQNSPAAFRQAISDGADGIELDVRRTADGRLVVVHDPRVGVHQVRRLDHATLRSRMAPGQAPELAEVLAALAGRTAFDIELKEDGYVAEAMAVIARHLTPAAYVITSFHDAILPQVHAAVPAARTGLLLASGRPARRLSRRLAESEADLLVVHLALARAGTLAWAAQRGVPTWVWTVNEPRALRTWLADPRVGAVITDRARLAATEAAAIVRAGLSSAA